MDHDEDFYYASDADWDREAARELGAAHPERAWILTDRDVWHANPFYKGPAVPHPEDYLPNDDPGAVLDEDKQHSVDPVLDRDFDDVIPF